VSAAFGFAGALVVVSAALVAVLSLLLHAVATTATTTARTRPERMERARLFVVEGMGVRLSLS